MSSVQVSLRLQRIEDFFQAPAISPMSEWYDVYSPTSGIEYVSEEVRDSQVTEKVEIEIHLPAEAITDDLEAHVAQGIVRYCNARLRRLEQVASRESSRGWSMLALAVVVVGALVWVARQFVDSPHTLLGVVAEGFSITAWVLLWHPVDMLVFGRGEHRMDKRAFRTLREKTVVTIKAIDQ